MPPTHIKSFNLLESKRKTSEESRSPSTSPSLPNCWATRSLHDNTFHLQLKNTKGMKKKKKRGKQIKREERKGKKKGPSLFVHPTNLQFPHQEEKKEKHLVLFSSSALGLVREMF